MMSYWIPGVPKPARVCVCVCVCLSLSHVQLFVILWNVATQALQSLGILQAGILEWVVAIPFSSGSSRPRDRTRVS